MNKLKSKKKPPEKRSPAVASEPSQPSNPGLESEPELMSNPLEKSVGFERDKVRQLVEIYYDVPRKFPFFCLQHILVWTGLTED